MITTPNPISNPISGQSVDYSLVGATGFGASSDLFGTRVIFRNEETDEGSPRAISSGAERHGCHFPDFPISQAESRERDQIGAGRKWDSGCWCTDNYLNNNRNKIFTRHCKCGRGWEKGSGAVKIAILSNEQAQRESRALTTCFSVL